MGKNREDRLEQGGTVIPFPEQWIRTEPQKVEDILAGMTVSEQARCVMQTRERYKQDLLLLSPRASDVARALAPEEVYYMIKEIGEKDCLPVLSAISSAQLQYIFDLEWWHGDKFLPQRVRDWLALLEDCHEPKVLQWLLGKDIDQIVAALQSLIKVYKNDEMTDSYEGVENLKHFSPDGVYDIFFKVPEVASVLSKFLKIFRDDHPEEFFIIMEAVLWYPISPTVEKAYHWRMARTSERGIPEFEEAYEIYSRLNPEALKIETTTPESFSDGDPSQLPPHYLVAQANPLSFFSRCLTLLQNESRYDAIRWELVYLGNKVMVADRADPAGRETHNQIMQKVLGTVNIGLELGSGENTEQGVALLEKTWMQPLFQVGYGHLMNLKWQAATLAREQGRFLDQMLNDQERNYFRSLITDRTPRVETASDCHNTQPKARHFESLKETHNIDKFLHRLRFYTRFIKQCLNLTESSLEETLDRCGYPEHPEDVTLTVLLTTALAQFLLFKEISCDPLQQVAAQTFLEMIFLPQALPGEPRTCNEDLITTFQQKILEGPMAWTEEDKQFLQGLLSQCQQILQNQFGRIDFKKGIDWKFITGICVQKE
ncbi:MAG: DUF6178 family protein [Nitrospinota bacterium]|nr:DUF6178 family protein [Nitrospinota bacterium]